MAADLECGLYQTRARQGQVPPFLLQSSILDRMCGSLCDYVLGADSTGPIDGQAMLEALEQMNMFVVPLDRERRWYRYHHLFADVLNRHLEQAYPHLLPDLHRRASQWYEQGKPEKAREAARAAELLMDERTLSPWRSSWLKAHLARLWMAQGDFERVCHLLRDSGAAIDTLAADGSFSNLLGPLYFVWVRLHLAQHAYDDALAASQRLHRQLEGTDQVARLIETLVLQALAYLGKRDIDQAIAALRTAFALAQPNGYIRTFLDEGEPMARLLYQAGARLTGAGYAAELLSAMGAVSSRALPPAQSLIEPLTLRELEVLALIETGCSNQEIASRLVISLPTVKRHISNIYAKLGTTSRTQAVARGRELKLFE